jgi:dipeptidyl aminopeptidase/acylaminoacyl peptidase
MKDGSALPTCAGLGQVFLAGLAVTLLGSFFWGLLAWASGLDLEWLPVLGVGVLVGCTVGAVGHGRDARFGLVAVLLSQLGCFLGRFWSLWGVIILQLDYLPQRPFHLPALAALFQEQWKPINVIPYALAAVEGYHFAMRRPRLLPPAALARQRRRKAFAVLAVMLGLIGGLAFNMMRRTIVDVALSPDGRTLAVSSSGHEASMEKRVLLWDLPQERLTVVPQPHVGKLAWSPDGQMLAVLTATGIQRDGNSGRVVLMRPAQGEGPGVLLGKGPAMDCLAFAPDGRTLATGDIEGVKLWDVGQGGRVADMPHGQPVYQVAFTPDGRRLVAGLRDGTVAVWDVAGPRLVQAWQAHPFAVSALVLAPDGQTLLSAGSLDATVKFWDAAAFQETRSFHLTMGWVTGLAFAPGGGRLAVAGGSFHRPGQVVLLDPVSGKEEGRFETRANTVLAPVFTRDGKTLIAASAPPVSPFTWRRDAELYRWDVATGQEMPPLR